MIAIASGTVRWFDADKGYGYVEPDEGGEDLFVHYTHIEGPGVKTLERGQRVSYVPARSGWGREARSVRRAE